MIRSFEKITCPTPMKRRQKKRFKIASMKGARLFCDELGLHEKVAEMAEKYPDVYFSHGTGYMSNGKNFNNYFGRIYQARYLSGIVAGMNTKSGKIGYVAAMDSSNSEVTGGVDAFALGIYSVNPDAKVYVKVTNSWYDPKAEKKPRRQNS